MMTDEQMLDEWVASRRAAAPSGDIVDRVMTALQEQDRQRERCVRLADRMNESRPARWAACLTASLVGSLPFLLVAYVAKFLVF